MKPESASSGPSVGKGPRNYLYVANPPIAPSNSPSKGCSSSFGQ